jgi:hypothetical protein
MSNNNLIKLIKEQKYFSEAKLYVFIVGECILLYDMIKYFININVVLTC